MRMHEKFLNNAVVLKNEGKRNMKALVAFMQLLLAFV